MYVLSTFCLLNLPKFDTLFNNFLLDLMKSVERKKKKTSVELTFRGTNFVLSSILDMF